MNIIEVFKTLALQYFVRKRLPKGHIGKNSHIHTPSIVGEGSPSNIYLGDNVSIDWNNVLYCFNARLIVGNNCTIAVGATIVNGNHVTQPGESLKDRGNKNLVGKDIILEDDVWVGANVTLLGGTFIGRGAIVGAGAVVAGKKIPPYAIVVGCPCKIIGFRFTPSEIIEHEKKLYPESERLDFSLLEKNYNQYYVMRRKEIKEFTSLV